LTTEEQTVVSFWSYKTVLLLQMIRAKEDRPIPTPRFREVFELARPPADVRIWLGLPSARNWPPPEPVADLRPKALVGRL
jgi:hypothetical protein